MNLKAAIAIAKECGLSTIGETYYNIRCHAMNLFVYTEIEKELTELVQEIDSKKLSPKTTIEEYEREEGKDGTKEV